MRTRRALLVLLKEGVAAATPLGARTGVVSAGPGMEAASQGRIVTLRDLVY